MLAVAKKWLSVLLSVIVFCLLLRVKTRSRRLLRRRGKGSEPYNVWNKRMKLDLYLVETRTDVYDERRQLRGQMQEKGI